ncbi:MAG: hypothetical protein NC299_02570 [Lachnospiraceae bacterium]|nr:hypothetical protein [Ruminococcus sp.]MCM1274234.1 hypothetical protein [Lachnospiraceae bacterium]
MVRAKGRRRLVVGGRRYVWYVLTGDRDYWERVASNDWNTPFLHIISEDKRLVLLIPMNAPTPYVVSKGREFRGRPTSGCWERYLLPFDIPVSVTPRFVAEVIDWAVRGDEAIGTEYSAEFRV